MLAVQDFGPEGRRPLLIAHGLFGSGRNWGVIARRLSDERRVLTIDMRNHGESPRLAPHDYPGMAEDLAEVIEAHGGQADVIGHSMGGKAAMMLALQHPERVTRLLVADIAPVAYTHTQQSLIDAMRRVDLTQVETRGDADRQLALDVDNPGIRAFLLQSLDVKARAWRLNLDQLEVDMTKIIGFPEVSGSYQGRALFLSGEQSDYVRPEHRDKIKALFPQAEFVKLRDAGHWLHADKPREFEAACRAFFKLGDA